MEWLESRLPVLRSARPFVPSSISFDSAAAGTGLSGGEGDDQAMRQTMCDMILGEIQSEMDRVEREAQRRYKEELRLTKQPDYSWLIDWRLRFKGPLGFRESSEVELLCTKVRPGEWRRLLEEWRRRARFVDAREEVLDAFRKSVDFIIAERMQRECRLESVDEHHQRENGGMERGQTPQVASQQRRPQTARPRIPYPAQLDVFTLTNPPPMEQDEESV